MCIPPGSRQLNGQLHLCTAPHFFAWNAKRLSIWPISSLWGIQWLTDCVLPKPKVRKGVRTVRLIEGKAIIRCIQHFIYFFLVGSNSGNWNCGTCQRPIGAPVSGINKAKNKQIPHLVFKLKQSIISIGGLCVETLAIKTAGACYFCTFGGECSPSVGAKLNLDCGQTCCTIPIICYSAE